MRLPKAVLATLLVVFAAGNVWATLQRSTIPLALDGTVTAIDLRFEKERGVDDVYLVTLDGERTIHVDTAIGRQLAWGDRVSKQRWDRTLSTPRGPVPLTPSRDTRRMLVVMALVVLAGWLLLLRPSGNP